jgi:photosystem II stability/assembly factor-like uncharacterized protein
MVSRQLRLQHCGAFAAVIFFLMGCEAPLNLTGVEREMAQPIHRYDQFQASARHDGQVVVVGAAGAVLASDNDGKQWLRHDIPARPALIDVSVCADGTYVALDAARRLWISDSPGSLWQERPIQTMEAVMAMTCDDQNRIWVVGGFSTILASEDKGLNWKEDSFGDDVQLTSVQFVDDKIGYIAGEFGMVLKTVDGGASWEPATNLPGEFYSQAAYFMDAQRGWVVGLNGSILHTDDGGESWQSQDSGVNMPLYGITGAGETLFAVGENGIVLRYQAGTWQVLPHGQDIRSYLRTASASTDTLLVAGGNGALLTLATKG